MKRGRAAIHLKQYRLVCQRTWTLLSTVFFHTVTITIVYIYDLWRIAHVGSDNSSYSATGPFCHVMFVHAKFKSQVLTCSKATCYTARLNGINVNPIWAYKNNIHVHIWGSNPPVVNIIIIYIEWSTVVPLKKNNQILLEGVISIFFPLKQTAILSWHFYFSFIVK